MNLEEKLKKQTDKEIWQQVLWILGFVDGWIYEDSAAVDGGTDPVVEQLWFGTIHFKRKNIRKIWMNSEKCTVDNL